MEECVSAHLHIGGAPASHRQHGFMPKCPRRPVHFRAAERIAITRVDSLDLGPLGPVAMKRHQRTARNTLGPAVGAGEGQGTLLKAGKRVQGLEAVCFDATKTHHITCESNTQLRSTTLQAASSMLIQCWHDCELREEMECTRYALLGFND